jgi:hypothetical protein
MGSGYCALHLSAMLALGEMLLASLGPVKWTIPSVRVIRKETLRLSSTVLLLMR